MDVQQRLEQEAALEAQIAAAQAALAALRGLKSPALDEGVRGLRSLLDDDIEAPVVPRRALVEDLSSAPSALPPAAVDLSSMSLFPWQERALGAWEQEDHRGIIEAVTGSGKTRVGIAAIKQALASGRRAVVLVPTRVLQEQWKRVLEADFPDVFVSSDASSTHEIVVCTIQAAIRHLAFRRGDEPLLVADECHRFGAETFSSVLRNEFSWRLGLSATVTRGDIGDDIINSYFGGVAYTLDYAEARRDEVIAPYRIAFVGVRLGSRDRHEYEVLTEALQRARIVLVNRYGLPRDDSAAFLKQAETLARESAPGRMEARRYLAAFSGRRQLLAESDEKLAVLDALHEVIRKSRGTLIFTQTKRSAGTAASILQNRGCRAKSVDGESNSEEREDHLVALGRGDLAALAAPRILDEGVDVPNVELGIMLARSRSRRQSIQRLGRVVRRKHDGGTGDLVVVYALGTVEDPALGGTEFADLLPHATEVIRVTGDPTGYAELIEFLLRRARSTTVPQPRIILGDPCVSNFVVEPTPLSNASVRSQSVDESAERPNSSSTSIELVSDGWVLSDEGSDEPPAVLTNAGGTTDPVKDYLRKIGRWPLLSAEKEVELAKCIEAGLFAEHLLERNKSVAGASRVELLELRDQGERARDTLIASNLRLVVSLAKHYTGRGLLFLDLIQEGNIGLIHAVEKFDYSLGNKFSTYATWWVKQAITRAMANTSRTIRLPVHVVEKDMQVLFAIRQAELTWSEARRQPERLEGGWTVADVVYAEQHLARIGSTEEILEDYLPAGQDDVFSSDQWDRWEARSLLGPILSGVREGMGDRGVEVIRRRHGLNGGDPQTLDEIGRAFGVTRERIRQIEKQALDIAADTALELGLEFNGRLAMSRPGQGDRSRSLSPSRTGHRPEHQDQEPRRRCPRVVERLGKHGRRSPAQRTVRFPQA